jgi:hypothetical protein
MRNYSTIVRADSEEAMANAPHREWARAVLLDNGFLTEGELATFPRESLYDIARQRLVRWEETGNAKG